MHTVDAGSERRLPAGVQLSASYDAEALAAAFERPSVTVARQYWWERPLVRLGILRPSVTVRGRLLSHREWLPLEARFKAAKEASTEDLIALYDEFFRAIGVPPRRLEHLPTGAVMELVVGFLSCQSRSLGFSDQAEERLAGRLGMRVKTTTSGSPPGGSTRNGTRRPEGAAT
ncbi:MAG: hypothetical protein LC798_13460 [Chloroflexi bacterium]|nr:hypothetical protein [Chloroflexota bacterium]